MNKPRIQMNATILPNGKVLTSGGSVANEDISTAVKDAQIYDPVNNTFSPASTMEFPRVYHSNTLLLPDATVVALWWQSKAQDVPTGYRGLLAAVFIHAQWPDGQAPHYHRRCTGPAALRRSVLRDHTGRQ